MTDILVCEAGAIANGATRIVFHGDLEIGVIRHADKYYAYRNFCPHQGGPACEGLKMPAVRMMIDEKGLFTGQNFDEGDMRIVCPWHGYEFHLNDGINVCDARLKLKKYEVFEKDGSIYVKA